jgi:uncharacterized protein (TIGR02594 family)
MGTESVRRIQQALKDKGFDPGDVDGVWGRNTTAAVRDFQKANGLKVDGIVGPNTTTRLFAGAPAASIPSASAGAVLPWYEEAKHLMGTKEVLGSKSNPVILDWADDLDIHYSGDDVPWCGLFVAHCLGLTLQQEVLPQNPLGARQWERFGDATTPRSGAVMVFWRESRTSGKGHVGFYAGQNADGSAYQILGGNQSDKVCLTWLSKDRLLGARWPKTAAPLVSGVVVENKKNEELSTNEA